MATTDKNIRCLTAGCGRIASGRGICHACRTKLRRDINAGKTTLEEAEQQGRILPIKETRCGGRYKGDHGSVP